MMQPSGERTTSMVRVLITAAAVASFSVAALLLPSLALNWFDRALSADERLVPEWRVIQGWLPVLALGGLVPAGVWLRSRSWPALAGLTRRRRGLALTGLVVFDLVLVCAGFLTGTLTQKSLGERPALEVSVSSPDGRRTAHSTLSCLLWGGSDEGSGCKRTLHVQEGGSLTMKQVEHGFSLQGPRLRIMWSEDSREVHLEGAAETTSGP